MRKITTLLFTMTVLLIVGTVFIFSPDNQTTQKNDGTQVEEVGPTKKKLPRKERKKARADYFHKMMQDPATGKIPVNIRNLELKYAEKLPKQSELSAEKSQAVPPFTWREVGPNNVGGRTRALAVDINNNNIILAGGVDGGLWKSTDKGASWSLKSNQALNLSVTSVAQDPKNPNTWYYATGEYSSSTFNDTNIGQKLAGATGIFKSSDNGDSWTFLPHSNTNQQFPTADSDKGNPMSFVSKLVVSPTTSAIFVATSHYGIFRSTDGGSSFSNVLKYNGNAGNNHYNDVVVDAQGNLVAFMGAFKQNGAGIHRSTDNGDNWSNITADNFMTSDEFMERSVLALAPSNANILYIYSQLGNGGSYKFHKMDLSNNNSEDRTSNLPPLNTQGAYNMLIGVHPQDENFVVIGDVNLFRSTDGFSTKVGTTSTHHIGGYKVVGQAGPYANHHPDHHALFFDPQNPDIVYNGHDGGVTRTDNIKANEVTWASLNNGYNITQFFCISTRVTGQDGEVIFLGGAQDNGTPYITTKTCDLLDQKIAGQKQDVTSGDGMFNAIGNTQFYAGAQNGFIDRYTHSNSGQSASYTGGIQPNYQSIQAQPAFTTPFTLDPNNENNLYIGMKNGVLRNTNAAAQENPNQQWGWIGGLENHTSAMAVSQSPADVLYIGVWKDGVKPKLARIENASSASSATEKELADLPASAWLNGIGIHPEDANEILLAFSNYNIAGIYHSKDGGNALSDVSGNLRGTDTNPGPSIRDAKIVKIDGTTYYIVGTTIGVFAASELSGSSTNWTQIGDSRMGNATVSRLSFDQRNKVSMLAVGTHGRGAFSGFKVDESKQEPCAAFVDVVAYRTCDVPSEGQATISVVFLLGTPPYEIFGSYNDDNFTGDLIEFVINDNDGYFLQIYDSDGVEAILDGTNLIPCTKVALELLSFEGEVESEGNRLKWQTASEYNNDHFLLAHSTDGENFETIATLDGNHTTSQASSYEFLHKSSVAGTNYYRLSSVEVDGKVEEHGIVSLQRGEIGEQILVGRAYPNPVKDFLNLEINNSNKQSLSATLYDLSGKVVKTYTNIGNNESSVRLNTQDISQGTYLLTLTTTNGATQTIKVVK